MVVANDGGWPLETEMLVGGGGGGWILGWPIVGVGSGR